MGHPDNGRLLALRDGEIHGSGEEDLRAHLDGCPECREGFQALEAASRDTAEALLGMDSDPPVARARDRFLAQAQGPTQMGGNSKVRPFRFPWSLPKAASIALLLTGGVVSALPGSPVRQWLGEMWVGLTAPGTPSALQEDPQGAALDSPGEGLPETGVGIDALAGGVEIGVHGLSSEAELRVVWTDGAEAWVFAGEGTQFNRDVGRLDASSPPGAVRIEIPRTLERVVVRLNGNILLRKTGGDVEILGPVQERTPSEILFETPAPTNDIRL